ENDPTRLEARTKWKQAQALERDKDFEQALMLYEEAQQVLNDVTLANKIKELKTAWAVKSEAHTEARRFIYTQWPEVDESRMKERIAAARKAFETCRQAGDYLTPQKLLHVAINHDTKLKSILAGLNPDVNEEDKPLADEALKRITELADLMRDVGEFL